MTSASPVAVYGALRSGTTLLRLMLDAHPDIICPGETDFLFDHLGADGSYDAQSMDDDRIWRGYREKQGLSGVPNSLTEAIATLAPNGKQGLMMLHRHLPQILANCPDVRIIHLLRDPRDVARSSIGMGWAGDVYHGVGHWIRTEQEWQNERHRMSDDQVLEVSYEELIRAPEQELTRICTFLGLNYDPAMLDYDQNSTYSKPDASLTEQWKRKLSQKEIGLIEGRIGPLLEQSGYQPSGLPVITLSPAEQRKAKWKNRRARLKVQVERYGIRDMVLFQAGQKLKWPGLSRAARRRMDAQDIKRLK